MQQKSANECTRKARTAAVREVADWLQVAHATCTRTMLTATPEDLLVYSAQHWLANHAPAVVPDLAWLANHARSGTTAGALVAAPSSLSGVKSHLATEFKLLGRTGDWDIATQQGNPMHSTQVTSMLKGACKPCHRAGVSDKRGRCP